MRILVLTAVLLFAVPACSGNKCEKAFDHMKEVSMKEIDKLPKEQQKFAREAAEKLSKNDAERRKKFVEACNGGRFDADCILKAEDTMGYMGCMMGGK